MREYSFLQDAEKLPWFARKSRIAAAGGAEAGTERDLRGCPASTVDDGSSKEIQWMILVAGATGLLGAEIRNRVR
jgi:hypothetical protein